MCIICADAESFAVSPNAYKEWSDQAKDDWKTCVANLSAHVGHAVSDPERKPCDEPYITQWRSIGQRLQKLNGNPYTATRERFHQAIEAKNKSFFWNLIVGSVLHALSLLSGIVLIGMTLLEWTEAKQTKLNPSL